MKKKAIALALLLTSGAAIAAPGTGLATAGRTTVLNVFPNLGSSVLLTPLRPIRTARPAALRANRFADGIASNNRATALANAEARGLPGLEALGERVGNRADRRALVSRDGIAIGAATLDFDSSTSTNSDGSTSRTLTSAFERETNGSRTTKVLFNNDDATRTVDVSGKTTLDTMLTVNRDAPSDSTSVRGARLGSIESAVDYSRDASRSAKVEGTTSSDGERSTSGSTDYSSKFDSSRPFDGKAYEISYRIERTPANGETVVRSGDSSALRPGARALLRDNARDNAAQRQENRQERRQDRRDLASRDQLRERVQDNAAQRQENRQQRQERRAERREDRMANN